MHNKHVTIEGLQQVFTNGIYVARPACPTDHLFFLIRRGEHIEAHVIGHAVVTGEDVVSCTGDAVDATVD